MAQVKKASPEQLARFGIDGSEYFWEKYEESEAYRAFVHGFLGLSIDARRASVMGALMDDEELVHEEDTLESYLKRPAVAPEAYIHDSTFEELAYWHSRLLDEEVWLSPTGKIYPLQHCSEEDLALVQAEVEVNSGYLWCAWREDSTLEQAPAGWLEETPLGQALKEHSC